MNSPLFDAFYHLKKSIPYNKNMNASVFDPMYLATVSGNASLQQFTEEISAMKIIATHHFGSNVSDENVIKLLELFRKNNKYYCNEQ